MQGFFKFIIMENLPIEYFDISIFIESDDTEKTVYKIPRELNIDYNKNRKNLLEMFHDVHIEFSLNEFLIVTCFKHKNNHNSILI